MSNYTLTFVDVRRVQHFLFNANELKQNLGASALVEQATHEWLVDFLPDDHNVKWNPDKFEIEFDESLTIENNNLSAELIFVGGGNAAILFSMPDQAKDFAKNYTRHILMKAPGLEAAAGHVNGVNWNQSEALLVAWRKLQEEVMPKRKGGRTVSQALLGLGVTAECAFTGLPAISEEMEEPERGLLVSAEVHAKRDKETVKLAKNRLNTLMPPQAPFEYPDDFDDLGGEHGQARYIAVVHADGNSMGKRIEAYTQDKDNRKMVDKMRQFSDRLNKIGQEAMKAVCDWMRIAPNVDNVDDQRGRFYIPDQWRQEARVRFKDDYLPLRPIVFGGDDITFVCDGRLGLALAAEFLKVFAKKELPDDEKGRACAGIAIVHSHYPFARAYALAEELAQEAKQQARQWDNQARVSLINWHYASSGLTLDWDDIRQREYQAGQLLLRPLIVDKHPDVQAPNWRTWGVFLKQIQGFRSQNGQWSRNKLKDLRDALRQGKDAVEQFVRLHDELPDINVPGLNEARKTGWHSGHCIYFDALEADDLFIYPQEVNI